MEGNDKIPSDLGSTALYTVDTVNNVYIVNLVYTLERCWIWLMSNEQKMDERMDG